MRSGEEHGPGSPLDPVKATQDVVSTTECDL